MNRRKFLKQLGTMTAGAAFLANSPSVVGAESIIADEIQAADDKPFTLSILPPG